MRNWTEFAELIRPHQRIVLSSHVRPDADAIGSEIGLCGILEQLGKTVRIINSSPTPKKLAFLDPQNRILQMGVSATEATYLDHDLHIIVDTSAWTQLSEVGKALQKSDKPKIVIDHHVSADDLGAEEFKDIKAEATGTLIYRLSRALNVPLNKDTATALFCAIATDTGWFRFASTTSETHRIVADLIDTGVEAHKLYERLYEQYSLGRLKLTGRVLGRVATICDGRIAYTHVEYGDYAETQSEPADTEDLVNECLGVAGVEGALIFIEQPTKMIKISFRSRPSFDVARVAEQFQGGGHRQAAGATVPGPLAAAQEIVLAAMQNALQTAPSPV